MKDTKVTYVKGLQFVGETSSGHAMVMDSHPEFGGHNTGPSPMELLLLGIGGCSGMDIVSILKKKRQELTGLEVILKGEQAENHPKKFTRINLELIIRGKNISEDAVERAIDLSMNKYCSVKATIEGSAKINFSYRVIQE
ncbi:MAG: OsmC family protein [Nitrospirota bacterium]